LFNLALKQAHSGQQQSEKEVRSNNMEVPGCSPVEKDEVLRMILGKLPQAGTSYKPNFRFMNLPIVFWLILPLIIYAVFSRYIPQVWSFYPLAIIYVLAVSLMIYISYTKHRITVSEDFIIKQSGIWDISQEIIQPHKIQSISTSQFPWHKSLDIGHVTLHTAAGNIAFSYGNYTEIKTLVNWWLYQVESGEKDWM
jgi:putative membrane protein